MSCRSRAVRSIPARYRPASRTSTLTRRAVVLVDRLVDLVGVLLAGAEAVDGHRDPVNELAQARLVIGRHQRPTGLALTLRAHASIVPARSPTGEVSRNRCENSLICGDVCRQGTLRKFRFVRSVPGKTQVWMSSGRLWSCWPYWRRSLERCSCFRLCGSAFANNGGASRGTLVAEGSQVAASAHWASSSRRCSLSLRLGAATAS